MDYDEFGRRIAAPGNTIELPFGFAGGLYDEDTGLVRFGMRDYDPVAGRWTAKDPIGFAGGDTNVYAYVGNDPINGVDPLGLMDFWDLANLTPGLSVWATGVKNRADGIAMMANDATFEAGVRKGARRLPDAGRRHAAGNRSDHRSWSSQHRCGRRWWNANLRTSGRTSTA